MGLDVGIKKKLKDGKQVEILYGRRDYNLIFCERFCKKFIKDDPFYKVGILDAEGISKILKYCEDAYNGINEDYKDEDNSCLIDEHIEYFRSGVKEEELPKLRKEYWQHHINTIKANFDPEKDKDLEFEYYWSE